MSGFPATIQTNLTAANRAGLTLDADGTPGTEGAWEELIASANAQSEGGVIAIRGVSASATDTGALIDIGVGAAASEAEIFPNIDAGQAGSNLTLGKTLHFPQRIASAARVAARMEAVVASETAEVALWLFQGVRHMENVGTAVTYGADASAGEADGVAVTAGNGAFGTWTEIGTIANGVTHNVWLCGLDYQGQTNAQNRDLLVEIGHGPDSSNVTTIGGSIRFRTNSTEDVMGPCPDLPMYTSVTGDGSTTKLWMRIASSANDVFGGVIHGMSGTEVSGGSTVAINRDNDMDMRQAGSTDQSVLIHMVTTADGTPDTGVAHTDITQLHYVRQNAAPVSFAAADLAAIDSAHSDGGWQEYEATDAPGDYRLDLPDAALASGVPRVKVVVQTASSRGELTIDLTADNPRAAAATTNEIALEVLSEAQTAPIDANVKEFNDVTVVGAGTSGNKWRA